MVDQQHRGAVWVTAGSATVVVGTFLPWLTSGARNRSSYTIFDLVERLGFAPGGLVAWSLRLWPLVPLLVVLVAVGAWGVWMGRVAWRWHVLVTAVAVVWVGGTAFAVWLAPDVGLFLIGAGPWVTLVGVAVVIPGEILLRSSASSDTGDLGGPMTPG